MPDFRLTATSLTYAIGSSILVDRVSIDAVPGQVVAILGPNGAGKSTLLGLLSGDLTPKVGAVSYSSDNVADMSNADRSLQRAMFSQRIPVDVPFTARAVIELGRFPHRHDRSLSPEQDKSIVDDALAVTDTARFSDRIYATLSGGERTRVALARVLAQDTPLVLLDEPTTALDVYHRERVMNIIRTSADSGRTIVAVLHDLNAAAAYADTIVVMADGKVKAAGSVDEVLKPELLSDVYRQPMAVIDHPLRPGKLVLTDDRERPTR
jgi:heme transport system ATP-binding protein